MNRYKYCFKCETISDIEKVVNFLLKKGFTSITKRSLESFKEYYNNTNHKYYQFIIFGKDCGDFRVITYGIYSKTELKNILRDKRINKINKINVNKLKLE